MLTINHFEPETKDGEILFYRYHDHHVYGTRVELHIYKSIKKTQCGHWIIEKGNRYLKCIHKKRWISNTSKKRYAYPTKAEAINSFMIRKMRQIEIMEIRIDNIKIAYNIGKDIYKKIGKNPEYKWPIIFQGRIE